MDRALAIEEVPLALRRRGLCRYLTGDTAGAIEDYTRFLALTPHTFVAPLGEEAAVSSLMTARLKANPEDHFAYFLRGSIAVLQKRYDRAIRDLSSAVSLAPDTALYRLALTRAHFNSQQDGFIYGEYLMVAERHVRRATELMPRHPAALAMMTHILLRQDKYEAAADAGRRATELQPHNPEAWLNLGIAYSRTGEHSKASRAWSIACLLDPNKLYFVAPQYGRYEQLTMDLTVSPGATTLRLERGNIFAVGGQRDQAIREYSMCIADQPDFVLAHHHIGTLRCFAGGIEEGLPSFRRALEHVDSLR